MNSTARMALTLAGVCVMIGTAESARADEGLATRFGTPGTVAMSGSLQGFYVKNGDATTKGLGTTASVDVFVVPGLSLGVSGLAFYAKNGDVGGSARAVMEGGGLRVGYYVPLGERVGLWPMVSAEVEHLSIADGDGVQRGSSDTKQVRLLGNILFHVDRGWFLTVTPGLLTYSTSSGDIGILGSAGPSLAVGFGGYF